MGTVEAGTCGALRMQAIGVVDGREAIVIEHVTRLAPDVAPDWPTLPDALGYRVVITGQPDIDCSMAVTLRDRRKAGIEGMTSGAGAMVATAMRVVNAVPYVVDGRTGFVQFGRLAVHDSPRSCFNPVDLAEKVADRRQSRCFERRGPARIGGDIESVKGAANDLKLRGHSCRLKANREIDVFIVEQIRRANADPCRGQAGEVAPTTRRRVVATASAPGSLARYDANRIGCPRPSNQGHWKSTSIQFGRPTSDTGALGRQDLTNPVSTHRRVNAADSPPPALTPKTTMRRRDRSWLCDKPFQCGITVVESSGIRMSGARR